MSIILIFVILFIDSSISARHQGPPFLRQSLPDEMFFKVATEHSESDKPFIIECEAEGEPAPRYRWIKNGKPFDWQAYDNRISQRPGRGTLVFHTPRNEDIGQYQCFAENEWGTATSNSVFVHKAERPPFLDRQPPPDELLFEVATEHSESDKPFIIECEAEGEPAPRYRWIKNGKPFDWQAYDNRISQQPGRGTLVFHTPRNEDIGQYQCFAENEWGTATSNSVFVRKAELNSFKAYGIVQKEADEGTPYQLKCEPPDGWPKPNVYWLIQNIDGGIKTINNSRITWDPEGTLWFSNVTKQDASEDFVYACSASSIFINEYKIGNRVMLSVLASGHTGNQSRHEPIQQYVSRKDMVALRRKNIEIYCIFGGTPLPQITWSKKGGAIPWDKVTQNNYGKSLVIKHVDFSDAGSYTCEATNGVGQAKSYSINLQVQAAPYFTEAPEIVNAAEDETVEFRCAASGVPEPQIKWVYNGLPIDQAPHNPRRKVLKNKIIINRLVKNDIGNYGCNATNAIGYEYKDVYVNVLGFVPEITEPPTDAATVEGKTINLTCRVFGAPKPLVKWIKGGVELTGGRYSILDNGDLQIKDINFFDAGQYLCHANNKFGIAEAKGSLEVKERTRIMDSPEDWEVLSGTTATFHCIAVCDSSLKLKIDWLKEGQEIDFEEEPRFSISDNYSLTITKTSKSDTGTYTCRASTDMDSTEARATLIVEDVPNSPDLLNVQCNKRDAKINWQPAVGYPPILSYTIQYSTSFTPDKWENAVDSVSATASTYTVPIQWTDPCQLENYKFRVIAWNKIGPSPVLHSIECNSKADFSYKNPDNVQGNCTHPDNLLVITWTPLEETGHNSSRIRYRVSWKPHIPGEKWNSKEVDDWKINTLTVKKQNAFLAWLLLVYKRTQYRVKVEALYYEDEHDDSPCIADAKEIIDVFCGMEEVPSEFPRNLTALSINSTTVLFTWDPINPENVRGAFKGYKIQTWIDMDGKDTSREIIVRPYSNNVTINDFVPNSKHYARILAYNGGFNGPVSETIVFQTPEGIPDIVKNLEATTMGSSAIFLRWQSPEQTNGVLTGYHIYYQILNGDTNVSSTSGPLMELVIKDPNQNRAKLSKLRPDFNFRIGVSATTRAGEGESVFIVSRTNAATVPDKPKFRWTILSPHRDFIINVTWTPELGSSSAFGKYALEVNTDYADYKKLHEGQKLELTCKNNVDNSQAVTWTPPSYVPYDAYTLDIKHGNIYTLTFKNSRREYAGKYKCISYNRNGEKLYKDVHVGVPPKTVKFLVNGREAEYDQQFVFCNKENVKLECVEDKYTYPKAVYIWRKNNVELEDKNSNSMVIKEDGIYACKLANSVGSSKEHSVNIRYDTATTKTKLRKQSEKEPGFESEALEVNTDYADYKVLHENQELELTCKNNADNTQAVTWTPPSNVPNDAYTLDIKHGNIYALTFKNARKEYAGKYTCTSHAKTGEQITRDVHVGVSPKITQLLVNGNNKEFTFCEGNKVELECIDDRYTYPKSVYEWKKYNKLLYESEESKFTVKESGMYSCILTNSIGSDSKAVKIEFLPKTNYPKKPSFWDKVVDFFG